jgi:hypothetical protein
VGIADHPGDTGERGDFFRGALGIATGDDNARSRILRRNFANGVTSLGVCCGGDSASVDHHDFGGFARGRSVPALEKLMLERGAVSLSSAAAKLFNVKSRHVWRIDPL